MLKTTHLNPGTGDPWAGQVRVNGLFNFPSNPVRWVIPENFGIDPPMGSEKSKNKIPNQMLEWEFLELDEVPC